MSPAEKVKQPPSPRPRPKTPPPGSEPPGRSGGAWVRRTWWMPWLLGSAVVAAAAAMIVQWVSVPDSVQSWDEVQLPTSSHQVLYEVTGKGRSPEIRFVTDGVAATEVVSGQELPWSKEFTLEVGPGLGVVQVMASNTGESDSVSCAIKVDGVVVHQATAPGEFAAVSCSSVIRPGSD